MLGLALGAREARADSEIRCCRYLVTEIIEGRLLGLEVDAVISILRRVVRVELL